MSPVSAQTAFSSLSFYESRQRKPGPAKAATSYVPPSPQLPFPQPRTQARSSPPRSSYNVAGYRLPAPLPPPGPTGMVPPPRSSSSPPLPPVTWRGPAGPAPMKAALLKGCFRSSAQKVQRRQAALSKQVPAPVPDLTSPSSAVNRRCGRGAFPQAPSHPVGPPISSRPRRQPAAILCAVAATQIQ